MLPSEILAYLAKQPDTTIEQLFLLPATTLAGRLKLSVSDTIHLLQTSGNSLLSIKPVSELQNEDCFTTGDTAIDQLLNSGVHIDSITEIAGKSASAKSQFSLQLALTVQLPLALGGLKGGAIVISSEGIIASPRLLAFARGLVSRSATTSGPEPSPEPIPSERDRLEEELDRQADAISQRYNKNHVAAPSYKGKQKAERVRDEWDFLDNVSFIKAPDVEALDHLITYAVPAAINRIAALASAATANGVDSSRPIASTSHLPLPPNLDHVSSRPHPSLPLLPIRLIILDSIAAPFRAAHDHSNGGFIQRSKDLGLIADKLKRLAGTHRCAIVVVNQVSDVFDSDSRNMDLDNPLGTPISPTPEPPLDASGLLGRRPPPHLTYSFPSNMYTKFQNRYFMGQSRSNRSMAALGYQWSNLISTRIILERTKRRTKIAQGARTDEHDAELEDDGDTMVRKMSLIFSPFAPRGEVDYVCEHDGIRSWSSVRLLEERESSAAINGTEEKDEED